MVEDRHSTIRVKESTKVLLDPYKKVYGTYEKGILELIENYERGQVK